MNPTIVALRARTRGVLVAELERTLGGKLKHLGEMEKKALEQMIDSATNKLLHAPTTRLKAAVASAERNNDGADLARAMQQLFDLPEEGEEEGQATPAAEPSEKRLPH